MGGKLSFDARDRRIRLTTQTDSYARRIALS
jgi:hypothetical protein